MTRYHSVDKNRPPVLFSLSLLTLLVACGDGNSPLESLEQDASAQEVAPTLTLGAAPTEIRPSISAAQLLTDNSMSVNDAQNAATGNSQSSDTPLAQEPSVAQEITTAESGATDEQLPSIGAALPDSTLTPIEQSSIAGPSEPQTGSVTESVSIPSSTNTNTDVLTTDGGLTSSNPPAPTITIGNTNGSESEPEQAAALPETTQRSRFTGSNTPTFVGELLPDQTVQLTWEVDPTARGYNVYRDAEYIETVFEASYLDDFDPYDQNYYYEIQAFDFDENYSTIATGLTVAVTGTGRTDPNAPKVDTELLNDYELVFSDEFNGTTLDTSKWNTAYIWGDDLVFNNELQHYVDTTNDPSFGFNPFSFDGESLTISTVPTPPDLLEKANGQEYLSGVITSYDAFKFTYGYVEARAQVPVGKGYWPAFWLLNAYYDQDRPEIDIMEFIGDNQDTVYHTFHYYDEAGDLRSTKSEPTFPIDFSAGFHTFGVEWEPGSVTFYVDGIARHKITDPKISQEEMYIIANTAIGGWWPGDPDETTSFPGEYKIDYIRAYQRVGVQLDAPQFENPESLVPVRGPGTFSSPSHIPPFEL